MRPSITKAFFAILTAIMVLSWFDVVSELEAIKMFAFFAAWFTIQSYSAREYPRWWSSRLDSEDEESR